MEASELAEKISEAHHHHAVSDETFRRRTAMVIGVIAMLLAITTLGGSSTMKTMLSANIHAADTYNFYQSRNIRQTATQLAAEELEVQLATRPDLTPAAQAEIQKRIDRYRARVARYESDPQGGEGKKELLAKAKQYEAQRDRAIEADPNFEFGEALFQIAIVLGSVSIVAGSRLLLWVCVGLAGVASLLSLNGFFLFVHLPFH
ncbi:MAG: DUF4337 domain-containing protein [Proteobacteria bacterium]|nr:DUF4337 domain-containing protein [Pseudomonadota bacterium]